MKAFIPYFCLIIILQLCACASQTDSLKLEKGNSKEQKARTLSKEEVEDVLEEEEPKSLDDIVTEDVKKDMNQLEPSNSPGNKKTAITKTKGNASSGSTKNSSVQIEDKIEALSIISYTNIIETTSAEMPVQGQKVKLMIKNNHKQAMWYLMPVSGEKTMPSNGQFYVNPEATPPFLAKQYGTSERKLIELIYHGKAQESFRAFYIEAGGSLLFRNYDLGTYQEGEYVPFWAIKGLEVDNKTSLEEWLPFSVVSSPDVVIHNTTESGAAKWFDAAKNANFSNQKIEFVQANGIKKYQIPVGVIR